MHGKLRDFFLDANREFYKLKVELGVWNRKNFRANISMMK